MPTIYGDVVDQVVNIFFRVWSLEDEKMAALLDYVDFFPLSGMQVQGKSFIFSLQVAHFLS